MGEKYVYNACIPVRVRIHLSVIFIFMGEEDNVWVAINMDRTPILSIIICHIIDLAGLEVIDSVISNAHFSQVMLFDNRVAVHIIPIEPFPYMLT